MRVCLYVEGSAKIPTRRRLVDLRFTAYLISEERRPVAKRGQYLNAVNPESRSHDKAGDVFSFANVCRDHRQYVLSDASSF